MACPVTGILSGTEWEVSRRQLQGRGDEQHDGDREQQEPEPQWEGRLVRLRLTG